MTTGDIVKEINGKLINGSVNQNFIGQFKTNSKIIDADDCFIAINSGHQFIDEAIAKGAKLIICNNDFTCDTVGVIKVDNTIDVLLKIAGMIRKKHINIPVIAVTGSVGKTTTKELIYNILSSKYKVLKSNGNKNNQIGMSETLFKLNADYDICLLEMGMNHLGEISELSKCARPTDSVITNIGTSHIGYLKSQKNILKAKLEILDGMTNGTLFINGDDKFLKQIKYKNLFKVGVNDYNDLIAYNIVTTKNNLYFKIKHNGKAYYITLNIPNDYLIPNVLLAIKVGLKYEVPIDVIIDKIKEYNSSNHRNEIIKLSNNIVLIDDCYNASFESIVSGLSQLKHYNQQKIIIIGDVLELGKHSKKIHKSIGIKLEQEDGKIILVGKEGKVIKNKKFIFKDNYSEVIEYLKSINLGNHVVYIKGSRKMRLEEIKKYLENI